MGRPKIKTIESDFDLEKVRLPEERTDLPVLDEATKELVEKQVKAISKRAKTEKVITKKPSKRYNEALKLIDKTKAYTIAEAVEILKKTANTKFDSSVEAHINLQIDSSKQEQQIRTTATLPHGNGKKLTVLVFGAKDAKAAKESGALIGDEETLEQIEKGKINLDNSSGGRIAKLEEIDKVVASPEWMPKLAKVAKILGPKGLMPNPKSGTVNPEPEKIAAKLGSGMVEIKTENSPIIHVSVGKASFKNSALEENITGLLEAVKAAKPAELKKELIKNVYLTTTMGPSVKLDPTISNSN